jgi:hypothetical protein
LVQKWIEKMKNNAKWIQKDAKMDVMETLDIKK